MPPKRVVRDDEVHDEDVVADAQASVGTPIAAHGVSGVAALHEIRPACRRIVEVERPLIALCQDEERFSLDRLIDADQAEEGFGNVDADPRLSGLEDFRDHALTQLWAFKYDSRLDGIELHADIAAVNLNFWITPDAANLDPDTGGLVVWDKEAPPEWGFDDYNTSTAAGQARITRFLEESGSKAVRVPYRANRAVLFNSDLFHRTDPCHRFPRSAHAACGGSRTGRTRRCRG